MTVLFFLMAGFLLYTAVNLQTSKRRQEKLKQEQQKQKQLLRIQKAEAVALARKQVELEREQIKLRKEQEKQAKEQERQAAQLAKHEEQIMKLEQKLSNAERDIDFNRKQVRRLNLLLHIEESERDVAVYGGKEWQKHHKKVIAIENQIHSAQKKIDKAQADKYFCESKLSA